MEILSTTIIDRSSELLAYGIVFWLLTAFMFFASCISLSIDEKTFASIPFVVGLLFGLIAFGCTVGEIKPYKQHEVRITDMSKFDTEKYEIIEQRGKIFVVKEITKGDR